MENNIYKFYENKSRLFGLLLACIVFLCLSFWEITRVASFERLMGYSGLVLFGLGTFIIIFKIFKDDVFVEATQTYIKMYNFEKLL